MDRENMNLDEAIADVRAQLLRWEEGEENQAFWALLEQAQESDPDLYQQVWLPYLSNFTEHWETHPKVHHTLHNIQKSLGLAPFVRIAFQPKSALPQRALKVLAKSQQLQAVETLDLREVELVPADVELLLHSPHLAQLRQLKIRLHARHVMLRNGVIEQSIGSPVFPQLTSLSIDKMIFGFHDNTGNATLDLLASAPPNALRKLSLKNVDVEQVPSSWGRAFPTLVSLHLADLVLHDEWLSSLISLPHHCRHLSELRLNKCHPAPAQLSTLLQGLASQLRALDLSNNEFDASSLVALTDTAMQLETLDLSFNPLGDEGLKALANTPHLSSLRCLRLQGVDAKDEGIIALAQSPHLQMLETLSIDGNQITSEGYEAIERSLTQLSSCQRP